VCVCVCVCVLLQEARALLKARRLGVVTPVVYHVDTAASCLYLEFVPGKAVKQHLRDGHTQEGTRRDSGCR